MSEPADPDNLLHIQNSRIHRGEKSEVAISFLDENGEQVGYFDFTAKPMTFSGDVDQSARMFVDCVLKMMGEHVVP